MRGNKPLRQAIATALQGDRTLDSVVPPGIPGHVTSFPVGGKATPRITWKNRIPLTLTYDSTAPDAVDIATQIRTAWRTPAGSVSSFAGCTGRRPVAARLEGVDFDRPCLVAALHRRPAADRRDDDPDHCHGVSKDHRR